MSGPFKVGDVVVCVDARTPIANPSFPPLWKLLGEGKIYTVSHVARSSMKVAEVQPWAFEQFRFRHLPKADPAFTEAMRALRPEKEGVA